MRALLASIGSRRFEGSWVLAFFIGSLLVGCAGSPTFSRSVYEDPSVLVRLDSPLFQGDTPAARNSHPVTLTPEDLAEILRSVNIQKEISLLSYYVLRKDPKPERVFSEDVAKLLVPHLSTALAEANPDETVVFFLNRPREDGIPLITSGAFFVRGELLFLELANVRTPITTERRRERVRENPLTGLSEPDFHFLAGPHQVIRNLKKEGVLSGSNASPALQIRYMALLAGSNRSERPLETFRPPRSEAQVPSHEEKLRQLKAWYEQGLILEEEYQRKREEVLESF